MAGERKSICCPSCGSTYCPVRHVQQYTVKVNTRNRVGEVINSEERVVTRRFRTCQHCQVPFVTVETLEDESKPGQPLLFEPGPQTLGSGKKSPKKKRNPYM